MNNETGQQGQGSSSSAIGGGSGGGGFDQFNKWIESADEQQLARAAGVLFARIGTLPQNERTRDVMVRELRQPQVQRGLTYLTELTTPAH